MTFALTMFWIMNRSNNIKKKDIAKELFLRGGCTMEDIAAKVGITRQTLSRWAKDGSWDDLRVSMVISQEQLISQTMRQISAIYKQADARPEGQRQLTAKEADTVVKLSSSIKKLQKDAGITDVVNVGIKFTDWLRAFDLEKAKEYNGLWDSFIKDILAQ